MKQINASNLLPKMSVLLVALVFCGSLPVLAASKTTKSVKSSKLLQQRIDELESQVKHLEALITKVSDKTDAVATKADAVDGKTNAVVEKTDAVAAKTLAVEAKTDAILASNEDAEEAKQEFNRVRVKVEALEDSKESSGFKDLKISGMIDPTYIYNNARNSGGFNFLSNFNGSGKDVYAYDNSYFGQSRLQFDKELEGGIKFKLAFVANKSVNFGSIIHEASMSVPLGNANTRLIAGQLPDWSGYEYYFGDQTKLVTHNLLFDFTIPNYYTGAGIELIRGALDIKGIVANMNVSSNDNNEKGEVFAYRGDYSLNEFSGIGFAGIEGEYSKRWLDTIEVDGYYTRGKITLDGHVTYGQWKKGAFNGGDAQWAGISGLFAYKFQPRLEGIVRLDYLQNDKNGGGTFAVSGIDSTGAGIVDSRNGFGPTAQSATDYANGLITEINGANRSALSLGLDYALYTNIMLKAEYRFDYADLPVFKYEDSGSFKNFNQLLGLSTVMSF